jgi:hypothetical protein
MTEQNNDKKKEYIFGEIKEYDLEKIEQEVLKESVYLDVFAGSDVSFKQDIKSMNDQDVIEKLQQLNAYSYNYDIQNFPQFSAGEHFGLMANEVEKVFPNLVKKDEDNRGYVNYQELIPLLVNAVNNLSAKVQKLEAAK